MSRVRIKSIVSSLQGRLGLENGSERSKINTAKMASILIENVKKCTRIMEIIMFMITN